MIKATAIYGIASMLPTLLGFIFLPLYSKYLTTAEFGIIAAMGVLSSVISVFSNLALDRAASRFYFDSNDQIKRKIVLSTFFLGSFGVAIASFLILILAKPLLIMAYPEINFYPYYFLTIITVSFSVCENFIMGYFLMAEKPRWYLTMTFLKVCLQASLIYTFVLINKEGALGQIHALLFATFALLPIYLGVAYKNFGLTFSWKLFKEGVSFSWPFIPTLIIAWILNWSDSVFIANYCTMSEVGLYAMAYRVSMAFFIVTGAFSIAYQPVFFRKANDADQKYAKQSIYSIIHIASRAFIVCGFLLALFSEDIVRLFLNEKYREIHLVIRVILLSHILVAIMGISSNLYYLQSKRSKLQLVVVSTSAVVNIILNYMLVPIYGIYGAAFATVLSVVILTIMHYSYSRTCYFINIYWWKLSVLIGISALTILLFQKFVEGLWISLPLKLMFMFVLGLVLLKNRGFRNSVRDFRAQ
jgi:O-antigen/teichoic acid export membrane protein